MGTDFQTKGNIYYVDVPVPYVVEENFGGDFCDDDALALAEELQESVCLSLQGDVHGDAWRGSSSTSSRGSSSTSSRLNNDPDKNIGKGISSRTTRLETQLSLDEAIARELQELELDDTLLHAITRTQANIIPKQSSSDPKVNAANPSQVTRVDGIDPDNMTYEELQQLGENAGAESRGLPDELIALLPSSTYKTGFFSRTNKHEICVICYMAYENKDKLSMLPCQHQYHKGCITKWLKINKVCPVCYEEVYGS